MQRIVFDYLWFIYAYIIYTYGFYNLLLVTYK